MKGNVVGLTGQTGAGKTTVAEMLIGFPYQTAVINADQVAKEVMTPGSACLKELCSVFGSDIIDENGACNRKLLAQRAFSLREKTELLNSVTHPYILKRTMEYIGLHQAEQCDMIIFDAPQLFESGGDRLCEKIIAVTAPASVRIQRIMKRDGLTEKEALLRINAQHNEEYYVKRADCVIDGSADITRIKKQLADMINKWFF